MTFRIAAFLIALFVAAPASAQWTWLNPKPQGHTLRDVEFLNDNTAIAVGDAGTILVTHDAGLTWSVKTKVLGITTRLNRISRVDGASAVVVGNGGVTVKTTTAGAQWSVITSPVNADLVDVDFLGPIGVVAAGFQVFRTDNGGDTWYPLTTPGIGPLQACELLSPTVVMAAGVLLARSIDSGQTWEGMFIGSNGAHISFSDPSHGAFAHSHGLYVTSDGGSNWNEYAVGPGQSETGMTMTDFDFRGPSLMAFSARASICNIFAPYDCSSYGEAQFSTNGGLWWTIDQVWPSELFGAAANGAGVILFVGQSGVIARRVPPAPIVVTGNRPTTAGGKSSFAHADRGVSTHYVRETNGIGQTGDVYTTFLRTGDGGQTWTESARAHSVVNDISFAPAPETIPALYAVGTVRTPNTEIWSSQVLKSVDGGASWSPAWTDGAYGALHAIDFASSTRSVSVGDGGTIVVIENDVVTATSNASGASLRGVGFATGSVAVAVGFSGGAPTMLRSSDGGTQWEPVASGATQPLHGIDFATDQVGVAVGTAGTIIRTLNGGQSWDVVPSPTPANLKSIRFWNASRGFIAGAAGTSIETNDGGASWSLIESPTLTDLNDVEVIDELHAVFSGPNQTVLDYDLNTVPTLISDFRAQAKSFAVELAWSMRDEAELSGFRIERSDADGTSRTFQKIAATSRSFQDVFVEPRSQYDYTLVAVDHDGTETQSIPIRIATMPVELQLLPNIPNPFNPSTTIRYVLPTREHVRVTIFDVSGRVVMTLVDREEGAGEYDVTWHGTGDDGNRVASGVYFIRMEAGKKSLSRKMVLLK